jgi:DNA-binding NarL/FixJ family response regulator
MLRILIADDHAIIRKGLKQILLEEYPSATIEEVNDARRLLIKQSRTSGIYLFVIFLCQAEAAWMFCSM